MFELTDGKKCVISKAEVSDAEAIIDFLNIIGGETEFLTFGKNEFHVSIEDEREIISKCLQEDFMLMLIAKVDGEIVSQLFLDRSTKKRLKHVASIGITVGKKYWGNKIGNNMIREAFKWAANKEVGKIELNVGSDNVNAIKLYQKLGFKIEATISKAMKVGNKFYDDLVMSIDRNDFTK